MVVPGPPAWVVLQPLKQQLSPNLGNPFLFRSSLQEGSLQAGWPRTDAQQFAQSKLSPASTALQPNSQQPEPALDSPLRARSSWQESPQPDPTAQGLPHPSSPPQCLPLQEQQPTPGVQTPLTAAQSTQAAPLIPHC